MKLTFTTIALLSVISLSAMADKFGPTIEAKVARTTDKDIFVIDYGQRKLFINCQRRGPELGIAKVSKASVELRLFASNLYFERKLPPDCQLPTSLWTSAGPLSMQTPTSVLPFSFEKLIPSELVVRDGSNSDDEDVIGFFATNRFAAHNAFVNGPWRKFKSYLQCVRAQSDFLYLSGTIPPTNYSETDQVMATRFGFIAPEFIYAAIVYRDGTSQAFAFSNRQPRSIRMNSELTRYILSVSKLEEMIGKSLPMPGNVNKNFVNYSLNLDNSIAQCGQFFNNL